MKKTVNNISNFLYFAFLLILMAFSNFYFATMIVNKLSQGFIFKTPIINLIYAQNTGAAFNLLDDSNRFLANFAIIVIFVVFLYLVHNIKNTNKKFLLLLSFFTAGIFGNLYERLTFGYVRDFFEFSFFNFPIFNISDVYITLSVIGFIIAIIFTRKL